MDFQEYLEEFYARYNVELIRAPEGFFYLRPRSTTLIRVPSCSELNTDSREKSLLSLLSARNSWRMRVFTGGTVTNCSPPRVNKTAETETTRSTRFGALTKSGCRKSTFLLVCVVAAWWFMGDGSKFHGESVFRFGADVRAGDDPREAQRRLIRDGEAMPIENHLQLNDETEESQPDSGEEE